MTHEEYLLKKKDAVNASNQALNEHHRLQQAVAAIDREYIMANANFQWGDKVEITEKGKKILAYVDGFHINSDGSISYQYLKCKKDGNMSQHRLVVFDHLVTSIILIKPRP